MCTYAFLAAMILSFDFQLALTQKDPEVRKLEGAEWEFVGAIRVKNSKAKSEQFVRFYVDDEWNAPVTQSRFVTWPSEFNIHAIYQGSDGKWQRKCLFAASRLRFVEVRPLAGNSVRFRLQLMIRQTLDMNLKKPIQQIYDTLDVTFENNVWLIQKQAD